MRYFFQRGAVIAWFVLGLGQGVQAQDQGARPNTQECVAVFSKFFSSFDDILSQSSPDISATKSLIGELSIDLRCDFPTVVELAKRSSSYRRNNTSPVFGADGKELLPRTYSISLARDRARVVLFFTILESLCRFARERS